MSEWDFKELGFISQEEMEASLARVREAKLNPKSDLEEKVVNAEKYRTNITEYGGIDFEKIKEGAREEALDKAVMRKLYFEEQERKVQKRADEINELLKKAAESSAIDKQKASEKKLKEETEKAAAEIKARVSKEYNLEDEAQNNLYRNLLKGLSNE